MPAPPPIDAKSYAKGGGKFYVVEEQVDNRVDGGDFEGLKSVSEMDEHVGVQGEQEEFDPRKSRSCPSCVVRLCDCM